MSASAAGRSSIPRTLARAAMACLVLILALFGGALLFFDSLVRLALTPLLATYGVTLQEVAGVSLRSTRLHVAQLRFLAPGSSNSSDIHGIALSFNRQGILAGQFQQLHIDSVALNIDGIGSEAAPIDNAIAFQLPPLPPLANLIVVLQALPGDAVQIDSLSVRDYLDNARFSLTRDAQSVRALLQSSEILIDNRMQWQAAATPQLSGQLIASYAEQEALRVDFTLAESDARMQLDATSQWQLAAIGSYLQAKALMPAALGAVDGLIKLNASAQLPTQDSTETGISFSWDWVADNDIRLTMSDDFSAQLRGARLHNARSVSGAGIWELPTMLQMTATAPATSIELELTESANSASVLVSLDQLTLTCTAQDRCQATQSSSVRLPGFSLPGISAKNVLAVSNGELSMGDGSAHLQFATGSRFELSSLHVADVEIRDFNALVQQSVHVSAAADGPVHISSDGVELYMPEIMQAGKATYAVALLTGLVMDLDLQDPMASRMQSQVNLSNLGSDWLPLSLRRPELKLSVSMAARSLHTQGLLSLAERDILHIDNRLDMATVSGQLMLTTPELSFEGDANLASLFYRLPINADILAGSGQGSATLSFAADKEGNWLLSGPIALALTGLSGYYEDIAIVNLSTAIEGELRRSREFISSSPAQLRIGSIDPGLPLSDITLEYAINSPATLLSLNNIEASLFGGKLRSSGVNFDWTAAENRLVLDIERLDISQLLAMGAYENIQASGFISGSIPLGLSGTLPSVTGGKLAAQAPGGTIRYLSDGSSGNVTLDFVNQALGNYQYDLLETTVDYLPSGDLTLAVRLQGQNPDSNNGQRINLNLNISDNIPALLRSLQAGRSITEALEKQLDRL